MVNLKSKAREVTERGYCVLESVYDEDECEQLRTIFKRLCEKKVGFLLNSPLSVFTRS